MLRVLHITNAYPYKEVPEYGIFVKEQVDSLEKTGLISNDTLFINGRRDGKKAYIDALGEIRRRSKNCDVIHCHHLYSGFVAAAAMTGKPSVISFLNDWLYEMDGVKSRLLRRLGCGFGLWWADRVIFKSPIPKQLFSNKRLVYLPNGTNADQFHIDDRQTARVELGIDRDATYILFVSSKDISRQQKRYDRFRMVLESLQAAHPSRRFKELLLVNQPRERVATFFNAADLHLMTSDYEGSPNSVKEALCCGTPVVTTAVGNVAHLLDNSPHSRIASSFEVSELANLVIEVLNESIDRKSIRDSFVKKPFSQNKVATELVYLYKEISRK